MTVAEALQQGAAQIHRRDAEVLLLHVLGQNRAWLLAHPEAELRADAMARWTKLVDRRLQQEPLQYILGSQEFYGLDLRVTPATLIPRPETELLVEAVLHWVAAAGIADAPLRIADVGTGTGALAVALAVHLPQAQVWALDLSPATQPVVDENAVRHGVAERVHFVNSDVLQGLEAEVRNRGPIDLVVSNPPYIPEGDAPSLEPQVREFEPHLALFAGEDGLAVYRRLIPEVWAVLRPGGLLAMEFGFGQQPALAELLHNWRELQFQDDLAAIPRLVLAQRPG